MKRSKIVKRFVDYRIYIFMCVERESDFDGRALMARGETYKEVKALFLKTRTLLLCFESKLNLAWVFFSRAEKMSTTLFEAT